MPSPSPAVLDDLIARRAFADTMRAWGENSPDPEWFKDDCLNSLLTSCGEAGVLIHDLLDEIAALRADASAETMRERAAKYCEAYADENIRMASDTILCCPVLSGRDRSDRGMAQAEILTVQGSAHSAVYHAATHLAEAIRALPLQPEGDGA